jgi:tRNA 2-selenouridine synthase
LLLEEYEHFPRKPDALAAILDQLRPLRGHKQVDAWQSQIATGAWPEFVASVLRDHYDLCYRRPGSLDAVYPPPAHLLAIANASPASYRSAATELIAWARQATSR